MLQGLLMCAMLGLAYGVFYLIYGKKGIEIRKLTGKRNLGILAVIAIMLILWVMALMFWVSGIASGDTVTCIVITFSVPVILLIWGIFARKKAKEIDLDSLNNANSIVSFSEQSISDDDVEKT